MVPMIKKLLFFVFCYSFLSSSLFAMRPVPTLEELAARKFFREVSAADCDLTDGTSITDLVDGAVFSSFHDLSINDYLKDQWKKSKLSKIGLPTHVLPVSSNKENDDLLAFNFMSSKLMMACDPHDGTLFSLGKNAIKILSLVNGTYKKSALIDIPDNLWNDIVFNSKTKDLVIASDRQLLILKKDAAGTYTIHKQSPFPGKGSPIIDEETGDIFCIGSTHIRYVGWGEQVTRDEIYQWKRTEDGSYADPVVYFSSETMVHVQVLRDEVTHGCIVISWNKENNHINLTVLEKDTGAVLHTFLLAYKNDNYHGQHNQVLATYGHEKGEFFIDSMPAEEVSTAIFRFYREGNEFRQGAVPMNPRNIWHDRSVASSPRRSMIYDHSSRTFIYSGYDTQTIHGFSRDLGTNIFDYSYRNNRDYYSFALKKANNKLMLLPSRFYQTKSAYIYNLGFERFTLPTSEKAANIKNLTWNQLILLEMIQKLAKQQPTGALELAKNYRDDFNTIRFILSQETQARCQFIETAEPTQPQTIEPALTPAQQEDAQSENQGGATISNNTATQNNHESTAPKRQREDDHATQDQTSSSNDSDSQSDDEQSTKRQRVA